MTFWGFLEAVFHQDSQAAQDVGQGSGDPIPFPTVTQWLYRGSTDVGGPVSCCLCTVETVGPSWPFLTPLHFLLF